MNKLLATCVFLLAVAALGCGGEPAEVKEGAVAPSFELAALDGSQVKSSSFKGQPVLLNFWATWCQPCLTEIPELKALDAEDKVQVVGIAIDKGGVKSVRPFVKRHNIEYPILMGDDELFQRFNAYGIPHTLLLDASYKVVKIYRGTITRQVLEKDLASIAQTL